MNGKIVEDNFDEIIRARLKLWSVNLRNLSMFKSEIKDERQELVLSGFTLGTASALEVHGCECERVSFHLADHT